MFGTLGLVLAVIAFAIALIAAILEYRASLRLESGAWTFAAIAALVFAVLCVVF